MSYVCNSCGDEVDPDARGSSITHRRDGTTKAFCAACMKQANQIADAHADPL